MKRRPAHEIVMKALKVGQRVEVGGHTLVMENDKVYILGTLCSAGKEDKEVLLTFDVPLNWFNNECEKISDEDLYVISCQSALMEMAQEKSRKRQAYWKERDKKETAASE